MSDRLAALGHNRWIAISDWLAVKEGEPRKRSDKWTQGSPQRPERSKDKVKYLPDWGKGVHRSVGHDWASAFCH